MRDDTSLRISNCVAGYCDYRKLSLRQFCERIDCGRSCSTIRRRLAASGSWTVDMLIPVMQHIADDLHGTSFDLWRHFTSEQFASESDFADVEFPVFWHPAPRRVPVLSIVLERHRNQPASSVTYGVWPYRLIPPAQIKTYVSGMAGQQKLSPRVCRAERKFAQIARENFIEHADAEPNQLVLFPRSYIQAPRESLPFSKLSDADRAELWESTIHDAVSDRKLDIGIVEDHLFPADMQNHFCGCDRVRAIGQDLVIKRRVGSPTRLIYERCQDTSVNRRLDRELLMLSRLREFVRSGFSTAAVLDELKTMLL